MDSYIDYKMTGKCTRKNTQAFSERRPHSGMFTAIVPVIGYINLPLTAGLYVSTKVRLVSTRFI